MANSYKNNHPLPALLNMTKRAKIYRHITWETRYFQSKKVLVTPFCASKKVLPPPQSDFVKKLFPPSISILGKCRSQIHTLIFYKKPIERGSPKSFLKFWSF